MKGRSMKYEKGMGVVLFLADDKRSKTGDPTEDEYEIMVPDGYDERIPYGKMIRMIPENDVEKYKPMGYGIGVNFKHAVLLGQSHSKDFYIRVVGYRYLKNSHEAQMLTDATGERFITVQFYEDIPVQAN